MNVKVPNLLCSSGTWGHSLRHLPVIRRGAEVNGAISKPFRNNLPFVPLDSARNVPCATLSRTVALRAAPETRETLMKNTQLLLINDMCGYGKVALSAMLPVLSHMGYRIHNLPTALVSDTLNYPKFYIHDTTEYVRQSLAIWEELGFEFDAISTGFIVTEEETRIISGFCHRRAQKGTKVFVDPIMGDNGKLYAGVPESTIGLMRHLLECADYAVPNYTEACLLTDTPIAEQITTDEARALVDAVHELGAKSVVITSAVVNGTNAVIGYDHVAGEYFTIPFELIPVYFPGTGDTFSAVLVGRVMAGWSLQRATSDAMRVVAELIERNADQEDKSAGLPIEACLDVIDHE